MSETNNNSGEPNSRPVVPNPEPTITLGKGGKLTWPNNKDQEDKKNSK